MSASRRAGERRTPQSDSDAEAIAVLATALFTKDGEAYAVELGNDAAAVAAHVFGFLAAGGPVPRARAYVPSKAATGWHGDGAILETVMPDRPFIVGTIREYLRAERVEVRHLVHPLLATRREAGPEARLQGPLQRLRLPTDGDVRESLVHAVLEPLPPERLDALARGVSERLADVLVVTDDFPAMSGATDSLVEHLERYKGGGAAWDDEVQEVQQFLRWLMRDGFVFLGYRSLSLEDRDGAPTVVLDAESGLGLLRKVERSHYVEPTPIAAVPEPRRSRLVGGPLLVVARTSAFAPIYRHAPMDYVGVKKLDQSGKVRGEFRLLGLFSAKAHAEESAEIPVLRRRLQQLLQAERVVRDSHDHREIVAIFNSLPKTELFSMPVEALRADIRTVMTTLRASAVSVTVRPDGLERGAAVMVILPRDAFSEAVRTRIRETLVARFEGTVIDDEVVLGDAEHARLHFFIAAPLARVVAVKRDELQREIAEMTRGWADRLRDRLVARHGETHGALLAERYARLLPEDYKAATEPGAAAVDVGHLEALLAGASSRLDLVNPPRGPADAFTALKLYLRAPLVLSEIMPVLEHLGLRVFAQDTVTVPALGDGPAHLHTFLVQDAAGARLDVERHAERLLATVLAVTRGAVESDGLHRLVVTADLSWQEIQVLRTYVAYAFQVGAVPTRRAAIEALTRHPPQAALLARWFAARFDPNADRTRADQAHETFEKSLDEVQSIVDDHALRSLDAMIAATVRTNYFRRLALGGGDSVAVKIDCARVDHMPKPRPLYEIFVHGPRMEGVHLRAGRIARGGMRWSDRPDDFRTEVLGLMKTQTVKNAVIVPVGAKGGFIVKGAAAPDAVVEAYATLVRGMLDLTDNLVGDGVVPPPGVVCHDEPDPYLVVAADKGTATFSDAANAIAAEYGFWLGDAFASGGSQGYDHKKMGITARGAWECVTLHFRELDGRDVARDPFTVTGIGDMSGDVFGNAMLRSRTIRLRAAFDHRHVFLDPAPDPEVSFAERERLFALPRSSWADYRPELLSPGGMVVARGTKTIRLSAEARALLGIAAETVDGDQLIQAVLRAPTDLLFNGGIGTYVKAQTETNVEVGDNANAAVRVNAGELRTRVIGEGGNLGLTQRARIELALAGTRLNTDAIDNSAGVDTSDHEVNLKIALQPMTESGALTLVERNRLLDELADDVAEHVLEHNRSQSRAISRDQRRSQTRLDEFRDMMVELEAAGLLDRTLEALPDREALRARRATMLGLTRPELAVLLAYAKMHTTRLLGGDAVCEDPYLERILFAYFPTRLVERGRDALRVHRLRRELIATTLTNRVVDLMGATFVSRTVRESGAPAAEVVRAFVVVEALAGGMAAAARSREAMSEGEVAFLDTLVAALERGIRWLLAAHPSIGPLEHMVERYAPALAVATDTSPPDERERRRARCGALEAAGVPSALAEACFAVEGLRAGLDIVHVAASAGVAPAAVAATYWGVGEIFDFAWLRHTLDRAAGDDRWERRAAEGLGAEVDDLRRRLTRQLLGGPAEVTARIATFRLRRAGILEQIRSLQDDLRSARTLSLPAIMVLVRELERLEEAR